MDTAATLSHPRMADPTLLTRIAERLKRELGAEHVIVYGSVARGEARADSDVDLLVIAPSTDDDMRRWSRARAAVRDLGVGLSVSPLVLTPDEVRARLEADNRFIRQIIDTGIEIDPGEQDARTTWGRIRPMPGANPSDMWRERARQDWQSMHIQLAADSAYGASTFLQQAVEKFLKGWLLEQGWQLQKTHRLDDLLESARRYDPALISFAPLCERVSKYYLEGRYPDGPGVTPSLEQVRLDVAEVTLLIRALFPDEQLS
jgi:predicted nucleotidyltransferase/HEPN domain-containing protein